MKVAAAAVGVLVGWQPRPRLRLFPGGGRRLGTEAAGAAVGVKRVAAAGEEGAVEGPWAAGGKVRPPEVWAWRRIVPCS